MTQSGQPITYDDACRLLGLASRKRPCQDDIDRAYNREVARQAKDRSTAVTQQAFARAANALRLLQEAKRVVVTGASRRQTSSTRTAPHSQKRKPFRQGNRGAASSGSAPRAGQNRGSSWFKMFWSLACVLFALIRAAFVATASAGRAAQAARLNMQAAGIPRPAIALVFLLGLLFMLHGCRAVLSALK